ncbi:MAG: hypothetical protein V3V08_21715 [Nannocystaceae bacterium]
MFVTVLLAAALQAPGLAGDGDGRGLESGTGAYHPAGVRPCELRGRVLFVTAFEDYRIQLVDSLPDARVQYVDALPNRWGQWQVVASFPDFTVRVVDSFPDFKVRLVDVFPGCPGGVHQSHARRWSDFLPCPPRT